MVNSRFEMIVGQASRQTLWLGTGREVGADAGNSGSDGNGCPEFLAIAVTEAVRRVVVDHARGLHVGIHDGRTDEGEAAFLHVLAQSVRNLAGCGHVAHRPPAVLHGCMFDKAPDVVGETAYLFLDGEKGPRILPRAENLEAIADDAWIQQQFFQLSIRIASDAAGIEAVEELPVALSLAQHRDPRETGLGTLEYQHLKQACVVQCRHSPFPVMVVHVEWVGTAPGTAIGHTQLSIRSTVSWPPCGLSTCWGHGAGSVYGAVRHFAAT